MGSPPPALVPFGPRPRATDQSRNRAASFDDLAAGQDSGADRRAVQHNLSFSPTRRRVYWFLTVDCLPSNGASSHWTRRWRKPDSNRRYRVTRPSFRKRLNSPLLDSPSTENSARARTETTRTPGAFRGADGSNPGLSSVASAANSAQEEDNGLADPSYSGSDLW
jgi:hypothetical protein